ncbi:hypothetical protein Sme01_21180 [Sphaerisporangium melleum]|uniref:Uncharacterized protein n=1 Tax=Sphaerisporangium melleum TaxID=321316 RepID=A0A917VUH5_9ACTN|nr:hypothetical protein GCM10007964_67220 [Sphaerisporangium melleum]GII69642.1 hypothetical protein Sme01_21180 [Sphaerisporangium melleum]
MTLTMCSTTGSGEAKYRALSAVTAAPPISSLRRIAPATTGTRLSATSPAGTHHPAPRADRPAEAGALPCPSTARPPRTGRGECIVLSSLMPRS